MKHRKGDPRDRHVRAPVERKRLLNVIYFVDSKRTRTLQVSLRTASVLVGLLSVMLSWSLIASGLLVNELVVNSNLREHTRNLLGTIFSYQTRYDSVYEKAYPDQNLEASLVASNEETSTKAKKEALSRVRVELPKNSNDETQDSISNLETAKAPSLSAKTLPEANLAEKDGDQNMESNRLDEKPPIALENFSSNYHNKILTIKFSLKNLEKRKKTNGTVIARAKFVDATNTSRFISMRPEQDSLDNGAENDSPSSDQHFNIRYYKNKVFHFDTPPKLEGKFTEVIVAIEDDQARTKEFSYKVNYKLQTPSVKSEDSEDSNESKL